jgi:hypothetical protein
MGHMGQMALVLVLRWPMKMSPKIMGQDYMTFL